jgi:hypothetical protein
MARDESEASTRRSFTDIFIRHPVLAVVVNLVIVLVGWRALTALPIPAIIAAIMKYAMKKYTIRYTMCTGSINPAMPKKISAAMPSAAAATARCQICSTPSNPRTAIAETASTLTVSTAMMMARWLIRSAASPQRASRCDHRRGPGARAGTLPELVGPRHPYPEGVAGVRLGDVARARHVVVAGLGSHGAGRVIETEGFEARAFQHEIDHLDGILVVDRVASARDLFQRRVYRRPRRE